MVLSVSQLASLTHRHIIPKAVDNIFKSNIMLMRLRDKGMKMSGGRTIIQPLVYAVTGASGSFEGYDILATGPTDQITAAEFQYRQYFAHVTISGREELLNAGPDGILDLLDIKRQIAELTLADVMGTALWASNSGGKDLDGFGLVLSTSSTYGGIAVADMARWVAKVNAASANTLTLAKMQTQFGVQTIGADHPTILISDQAVFDKYWTLLQANQRFLDDKLASAGFQHLLFNGVPYVVDQKSPGSGGGSTDNDLNYFNERYLFLAVHKDYDFKVVPIPPIAAQDVKMVRILWAGNLITSKREMQGKLNTIDPNL